GELGHLAPPSVPLGDHEAAAAAAAVGPAGRAVARRGARHRVDLSAPFGVQGAQAGYLDRLAPAAVPLIGDETLLGKGAVQGGTAVGAVARRRARHRGDIGAKAVVRALIQGAQAGYLDRLAPDAAPLRDHEPLDVRGPVQVEPARRAG